MLRLLQVRFLTGFLPSFPHVSRKTVTSTLAHSEGTACNWDEFSMLEAELWTTPSSFAPSVELSTGSVRTHFADNAANPQVAERRSYANRGLDFFPTNATLVGQLSTFVGPPWTRPPR